MRLLVLGGSALLVCGACDASFEDLRPERPDAMFTFPDVVTAGGMDAATGADLITGLPDAGGAGLPDAGGGGGLPDASVPQDQVVSGGDWIFRGYNATGSVQVVQLASGAVEVRLSDDFTYATFLPGPTLLLTDRADIGRSGIQPGDIELARLSQEGAQTFAAPLEALDRRFAWIYCAPARAEMNRAALEAP